MLILETEKLRAFASDQRIWQGIPSIEITLGGRLYAAFYSGAISEMRGNYCCLLKSDDQGQTWSEPIAVAYAGEAYRCFDPALWRDPLGRLWFTWSKAPENGLWASICEKPDADVLEWSKPREIAHDVMMNKPVVTTNGDWIFPVAIWKKGLGIFNLHVPPEEHLAYAYRTEDCGRTFTRLGGVDMPARSFDEHMILERKNGSLRMFVRTVYGIGFSDSFDGGLTWTPGQQTKLGGPNSRFHICRLPSGNLLLVNHSHFTGRNNLTAMISNDDGETWSNGLLLDERDSVSYPDCAIGADGLLYIIYDHERGGYCQTMERAFQSAREILMARVTEADILAEKIMDSRSALRIVVNSLSKVKYVGPDLHARIQAEMVPELVCRLGKETSGEKIIDELFQSYGSCCMRMSESDSHRIDELTEKILITASSDDSFARTALVRELAELLVLHTTGNERNLAHECTSRIMDEIRHSPGEIWTLDTIAEKFHISKFYLCHFFRRETGIPVMQYVLFCRLSAAKQLLKNTTMSVSEISNKCGFCSYAYFSFVFRTDTGTTPTDFRAMHTHAL